uniref:EF-hand calcium binding domain 14 n=1 Tax=Monopterus albus TaxID=43700 RepID=A0A3Q3RA30_MONAL
MKKRKELNALIGLGDSKRKKTKKGSGHRLLRTEPPDSESDSSSEDDEFTNLSSSANFGKRSYTQCCSVCYPLFLFIILAACVMACAGLIWMQIALKEDLDSLKEKLQSMEASQKVSSSEIPKLSEDLKNKERKLDDIASGDKGLSKLWSNLTEINRKVSCHYCLGVLKPPKHSHCHTLTRGTLTRGHNRLRETKTFNVGHINHITYNVGPISLGHPALIMPSWVGTA